MILGLNRAQGGAVDIASDHSLQQTCSWKTLDMGSSQQWLKFRDQEREGFTLKLEGRTCAPTAGVASALWVCLATSTVQS